MESFTEEMATLKASMADTCGNWEGTQGVSRDDEIVIKKLGGVDSLRRIQEEAFEVGDEVKKATKEFKVSGKERYLVGRLVW